jgi:polyhydroxybutyrate depolymerase
MKPQLVVPAVLVGFGVTIYMAVGVQRETPSELVRQTIKWQNRERVYHVHYPNNRLPDTPKAVMFVLHGGGGADAHEMASRTGINRIADREDFIAVYPAGVDGQWNDGRGKTFRRAQDNTDVDDVGFIAAVIDALVRKGHADPQRIYVMGLSNGGMMTYRLGIELGDKLAAIAAVIANLPEKIAGRKPVRPLPVLIMNGTDDPMMPWNGGAVRVLGGEYGTVLSTERTVRYWLDAAGLPSTPTTRILEDKSPEDQCTVEVDVYQKAGSRVEVVLYRIKGGGHNLPGGSTPNRPRLLGRKCMDINGVEVIWSFFKKHSLAANRTEDGAKVIPAATTDWRPKVKQVGDPRANYLNVEFTCDGKYMVWCEGVNGSASDGIVWHCGVDPATGELIPSDGRGFRAFETTSWARANPGCDKQGAYYVGADRAGNLILVRPTSPTTGRITRLTTSPDVRRRAVYPTCLPERTGGFVFFIQNERNPGAGVRANGNSWVELQYINLANPETVISIERQRTPPVGFAPMDVGFARWMRGRPLLTYGALAPSTQKVEIRAFDADEPNRRPFDLIVDGHNHIDPYPAIIEKHEYIFVGIDATATSLVYRRRAGRAADEPFEVYTKLYPKNTRLASPSLAQSHEPFVFEGRLYTVYQVNDRGRDFFETTFLNPGEIWLVDMDSGRFQNWLIAPETPSPVAEPEPLVTKSRVWVFYTSPANSGAALQRNIAVSDSRGRLRSRLTASDSAQTLPRMGLYRAETPLPVSR